MFGILTILVIILAIVITSQNISKKDKNDSEKSVLNTSTTQAPTPSPSLTLTPTDIPTLTPSPTPTTLTPTPQPNNDNQSNLDFKYPNSTTVSQNGNETLYESLDDPKRITDWYKDKIKSLGMNATSFVQTSTNGNILNKLVGGKSGSEVRVEITKQNNQRTVKIFVTL